MANEETNKSPYILGLDIGINSIGWAIVSCKKKGKEVFSGYEPTSLVALNSRIFEEMIDREKKVPKNQKRRSERGNRNRRTYYKQRRNELINLLIKGGLLPNDYKRSPERTLNDIDLKFAERKIGKKWSNKWNDKEKFYRSVYAIRNFALEEKLEPHEFGRLILHLQRRRGYFSNRGAKYIKLIESLNVETPRDDLDSMDKEQKRETRPVLEAIGELCKKLDGRTVGKFIWQESKNSLIPPQRITLFEFDKSKKRGDEIVIDKLKFRAKREMHQLEFRKIWEKQNEFHKLNDKTAKEIESKIFHQRPLQLQKNKVGKCNIYPQRKRSAMALLEFQEFRTLQMINNIKIDNTPLDKSQRKKLLDLANNPDELDKYGRIKWEKVAAKLKIEKKEINYNKDSENDNQGEGLIGNRTAKAVSETIGIENWEKLSKREKTKKSGEIVTHASLLIEDLLTIHDKKALYNRLVNHWKFASYKEGKKIEKDALGLAMNEKLESGYGKHSLKAIKNLLPYLHKGLDYYNAVKEVDQVGSITKTIKKTGDDFLLDFKDVPNIANPIVQKALYEMRRVTNSIVKRYGKPVIIRMEMAREMKSSKTHRASIEKEQRENRKQNQEAEEEILKYYNVKEPNLNLETLHLGVRRVSLADRNKFKMWKYEQSNNCPYCPKCIAIRELFSGESEIEHILPYTGFRQNYMNTVVSCRTCNDEKGKKTPYETWGSNEGRWKRIEKFAEKHYPKKSKLFRKQQNILKKNHSPESENDFFERHLNDTRYIATSTKKMLEKYGVPIDVNNGAATADLRRQLRLNGVLPRIPDSSSYKESETGEILQYDAKKAEKNRRDHFHHAIDAFVVAITDRSMLKAMIEAHKKKQENKTTSSRNKTKEEWMKENHLALPKSWQDSENLHGQIKNKLQSTVVSHMAKRKVWGSLHKETLYGKSHFSQTLKLENMKKSILDKVEFIAKNSEKDNKDWIVNEDLRSILLKWSQEEKKLELSERGLPQWKGKEIKQFSYKTPCMVFRKELDKKLLSEITKDWIPGTKTWIAEKSIHKALYQWLNTNNLIGKNEKDIEAYLKKQQPCTLNKKGKPSKPIKRVSIAKVMTDSYVKVGNSYVEPRSNHHLVLFHNGESGKERERRVEIVTMLEAAKRASKKVPIIVKKPPAEWEGEWHYELDLCVNDMVEWQDNKALEENPGLCSEHKQNPYFRVQKISSQNNRSIDLFLRHHSVSSTDSNWGRFRIQSLKNIDCRKVYPGNLGFLPEDSIALE